MFLNSLLNLFLVTLCYVVISCESLKILAITPHLGKSHQLVFEPLFKKLISNGHSVTLITRYPVKINSPNWRDINVAPEGQNNTELFSFDYLTGTRLDRYGCLIALGIFAHITCSEGLSHPSLQTFLKEENHFDVVLVEMFNTNCFMGVANKYNVPVIGLHSATWMPWMYEWFGVPYNPGYLPNHFLGGKIPMSFLQRVENTLMHPFFKLLYTVSMAWRGNKLSKQYVGVDVYENGDAMKNVSLLLINTHFTLNLPIPLAPNAIEIGGIHVDSQPVKKLPQDIETFIKESKHGVIYMSMGSTIRGDSFPEAKKQEFLKAFSRQPQRVIWKWEGEMVNKPDNIFVSRWAPQRDILCHPNVKLFISHSGLLGTLEGVDCSKPMLLLPQFGDQFTNAAAVEAVGGGLAFTLSEINEEVLVDAMKKLLSPQFAESARALSQRFKDRPLSPMDTALYWINYVVKHNGAPHMKTAAVDMPTYQYLLLDVIAFLFVVMFVSCYVFYLFVKYFVNKLFRKKENKLKKS